MEPGGLVEPAGLETAQTSGPRRPVAVVVLGMHRSGTSALTRVLSLLGLDLPRNLYAARPDNPLGYWEPAAVVEAHDRFLAAVGASFDSVLPLDDSVFNTPAAAALEDELVGILGAEYGGSSHFVVKDPRICRLVPVWRRALERFGAESRFVLSLRNPLEVAASLKLRNEFTGTKSLLLWLRHVLEAERHTRGLPRSVVAYESLLRDWRGVVDRVAFDLALSWPRPSHQAHAQIEDFLSPRRRHHSFDPVELESRPDVVDWVKRTYGTLADAAAGEPLTFEVLGAVRTELVRADRVFAPLLAESTLTLASAANAAAEERLARATVEDELRTRRADVDALHAELESARAEAAQAAAERSDAQAELAARDGELGALRSELQRVSAELAPRDQMLEERVREAERLRSEADRHAADVVAIRTLLVEREAELERVRARLPELEAALEEVRLSEAAADEAVAVRDGELGELRASVERLERELHAAREQFAVANAAAQEQREALASREVALDDLRGALEQVEAELRERRQELETAREQAKQASVAAEELRGAVAAREAEAGERRAVAARLELDLRERELALETAHERGAAAEAAAQELREAIVAREAELREAEERLELSLREREQALEAAYERTADADVVVQELRETAAAHLADLEVARASARHAAEEVERLRAEGSDAARRRVALERRLLGRSHERDELRRLLSDRDRVLAELREEHGALRRRLEEVEAQAWTDLHSRDQTVSELRTTVDAERRRVAELTAEIAERDTAVASLRAEVANAQAQLAAASGELQRLDGVLGSKQQQVAEDAETIASLRAAMAERERENLRQAAELERQSQEIAALSRRRSLPFFPRAERRRGVSPIAAALALPTPRKKSRLRAWSQLASWFLHARAGGMENLRTYRALRREASFDADAYRSLYPDVAASGLDPLMHFVEHGAREGRLGTAQPALAAPPLTAISAEETRAAVDVGASIETMASAAQGPPAEAAPAQRSVVASHRFTAPTPRGPVEPTDMSDFTFLVSRQRSGTNAIRSIFETHPEVFCFNEVFNFADKEADEEILRESNFFTFVERYAADDVSRTFPDNQERLFVDFLEYLRCLADKPKIVVDVKYNTTHFIVDQWPAEMGAPYLFHLLAKHSAAVLNVTRKNYLRYVLSTEKAWYSDTYTVDRGDDSYRDTRRLLDPPWVVSELERCAREDAAIGRALAEHPRLLTWDYAEIFPGDEPVAARFLEKAAALLEVGQEFRPDSIYRKQSTLALRETIENYEEVAEAIRTTPFAYCLEDEPAYRARASKSEPQPTLDVPATDWAVVIGRGPDDFCDDISRRRPAWVQGSISFDDARFLFRQALDHGSDLAVEIGTASGMSTAVLAHAADFRRAAGTGSAEWRLLSYDIQPQVYFDESRRVGDAARELLPPRILERVEFRNPATAVEVGDRHGRDELRFLFIDANHKHPWPAIDLLATLDVLSPLARVVFHDINLPLLHPAFADSGVKVVFDELEVEKEAAPVELPNIGAIVIPEDKAALRGQLLAIVAAHAWEVHVPEDVVSRILPPGVVAQSRRRGA